MEEKKSEKKNQSITFKLHHITSEGERGNGHLPWRSYFPTPKHDISDLPVLILRGNWQDTSRHGTLKLVLGFCGKVLAPLGGEDIRVVSVRSCHQAITASARQLHHGLAPDQGWAPSNSSSTFGILHQRKVKLQVHSSSHESQVRVGERKISADPQSVQKAGGICFSARAACGVACGCPWWSRDPPAALKQAVTPSWMEQAPGRSYSPWRWAHTGSGQCLDPMGTQAGAVCSWGTAPYGEDLHWRRIVSCGWEPMLEQGKIMRKKKQPRHVRTDSSTQFPNLLWHSRGGGKGFGNEVQQRRNRGVGQTGFLIFVLICCYHSPLISNILIYLSLFCFDSN